MTKSPLFNYGIGLLLGFGFGLAVGSTVTQHYAMQAIHHIVANDQQINSLAVEIAQQAQIWKRRWESCEANATWRQTVQMNLTQAAASTPPPPPKENSPLELLNIVRPGLGDLAAKVSNAAKAARAAQCPPGSELQTSPYWQGERCV